MERHSRRCFHSPNRRTLPRQRSIFRPALGEMKSPPNEDVWMTSNALAKLQRNQIRVCCEAANNSIDPLPASAFVSWLVEIDLRAGVSKLAGGEGEPEACVTSPFDRRRGFAASRGWIRGQTHGTISPYEDRERATIDVFRAGRISLLDPDTRTDGVGVVGNDVKRQADVSPTWCLARVYVE